MRHSMFRSLVPFAALIASVATPAAGQSQRYTGADGKLRVLLAQQNWEP